MEETVQATVLYTRRCIDAEYELPISHNLHPPNINVYAYSSDSVINCFVFVRKDGDSVPISSMASESDTASSTDAVNATSCCGM
jgi:hypothetical protein